MPKAGTIGWCDLTVENAEELQTFYSSVIGWLPCSVDMGAYSDFTMTMDLQPVAGICHNRGVNQGIPPVWMVYFVVADLDASIAECEKLGGTVILAPKSLGGSRYCIIRDPAGAASALYQAAQEANQPQSS